jgi:hypothetical protein
MTQDYKNFKTVWVQNVAVGTEFTQRINIPFPVKEIVVKSTNSEDADSANNNDNFNLLRSDLVGGQILFCAQAGYIISNTLYTRFKMNDDNINNEYTFKWTKMGDLPVGLPATFGFKVVIELLFLG